MYDTSLSKIIKKARKPDILCGRVNTWTNTEKTGRTTESLRPVSLNLLESINQIRF